MICRMVFSRASKTVPSLIHIFAREQNSTFRHFIRMASSKMLTVSDGRQIEYVLTKGDTDLHPTVIFVSGYMSNMDGSKAKYFEEFCARKNVEYIRFNVEAIGKSPGNLETIQFVHWVEDCYAVIEKLVKRKAILIGSSMGGWISMKSALKFPDKVTGVILIAPALNFIVPYYNEMSTKCTKEQLNRLDAGELVMLLEGDLEVFLRRDFATNSRQQEIDPKQPIDFTGPVHIIQGMKDSHVPYKSTMKLIDWIKSDKIDYTLRKNGGHRMSEPEDLLLISRAIDNMLQDLKIK